MGFDDQCSWGFKSLIRKKKVNFHQGNVGEHLLAKELSVLHLTVIGVGATIGAGVYILVGTVAREHSGPALALSFLISGIAAALSAFCYAELAGRCPSAGSAYHYSYICVGEVAAWLTGWALILEYSLGGSAVARGVSPNLAMFLGGDGSLPSILGRQLIPWLNVVIDPCAAILVFIVTGLLCLGIKESTLAQAIATSINVCVMVFVIITGAYLGFKTGWIGYELPSGFFPFGIDGMFAGSATVFFAYIGFDSLVSTAEEVRNPQRDLPLAIGAALSICCTLYMLVSSVVVGLVPYYALDPDTPIATAFSSHGMQWAAYLIGVGTISALCSTLMGSLLPQPRLLMAMARDGLLPRLFADIDGTSLVPVKSTVVTGIGTATLAFFMDVPQLAGMVSVGTLIAFTMAAISILIVRYVPPPSSLRGRTMETERRHHHNDHHCHDESACISTDQPLIVKDDGGGLFALSQKRRRWIAGWTIFSTCTGILVLTSGASGLGLSRYLRFGLCGAGGAILLSGLTVLMCIDQDDGQHRFGHVGGFICPMVPLLPILCILVNVYLLINLGVLTWLRVSAWLLVGIGVYALYGREHSLLHHADGAAAVRLHL